MYHVNGGVGPFFFHHDFSQSLSLSTQSMILQMIPNYLCRETSQTCCIINTYHLKIYKGFYIYTIKFLQCRFIHIITVLMNYSVNNYDD